MKFKTRRICLWSGPRNISTALMYSFGQRSDSIIVDEPFYAHYLSSTDADGYHPGAEDVLASQENDGQKVIENVIMGDYDKPIVFFKNMTHHLVNLDWSFMEETINLILTRDPEEMLTSYIKQIPDPTMEDVGYAKQLELVEYLTEMGNKPIILDSTEMLKYPQSKLREVCSRMGVPFEESMMSWPAGPRKEDGVWARYWYHNVHRSTGFRLYRSKDEKVPDRLSGLLEECQEAYNKLMDLAD